MGMPQGPQFFHLFYSRFHRFPQREKTYKAMNTKKQQNTESLEVLKAKKEKDGKLIRIGEWLLSGKSRELGCRITPDDMKSVLK